MPDKADKAIYADEAIGRVFSGLPGPWVRETVVGSVDGVAVSCGIGIFSNEPVVVCRSTMKYFVLDQKNIIALAVRAGLLE